MREPAAAHGEDRRLRRQAASGAPQVRRLPAATRPPRRPPPPRGRRAACGRELTTRAGPCPTKCSAAPSSARVAGRASPSAIAAWYAGRRPAPRRSARRWSAAAGRGPSTGPGSPWKAVSPCANQHSEPALSPHSTTPRLPRRAQHVVEPVRAPHARAARARCRRRRRSRSCSSRCVADLPARRSRGGTARRATARSAPPGSAGRSARCSGPRHPTRSGGSTPSGARARVSGQHVVVQQRVAGLHREPAATERHDLRDARHGWSIGSNRSVRADFLLWSNGYGPGVEVKPWRGIRRCRSVDIRLSEVISALSYALDLTEGQPMGHAVRSCVIGMRIGEEIGLDDDARSSLFYALLLKDAGCSSNAAKLSALFGADDFELKRDRKLTEPPAPVRGARATPSRHAAHRARLAAIVRASGAEGARDMTELRCERGAEIARMLELTEATAEAIRALDEHWDGHGYPLRPRRRRDPAARPHRLPRPDRRGVLRRRRPARRASTSRAERRGTLVRPRARRRAARDRGATARSGARSAATAAPVIGAFEPADRVLHADDERLDRDRRGVRAGHRRQVAVHRPPLRRRRRDRGRRSATCSASARASCATSAAPALLHDIGKLGVSNLILDKPGKLDRRRSGRRCAATRS